ncbi:hypothetical protein [Actinomadura terrae]|uniref:hypothetical protein n=1 Tax=Actinomadura terrae TaxID=604353 RepID=UPI001FA6FB7E|nr:hypothetical protein [Actinomadura terrae]
MDGKAVPCGRPQQPNRAVRFDQGSGELVGMRQAVLLAVQVGPHARELLRAVDELVPARNFSEVTVLTLGAVTGHLELIR